MIGEYPQKCISIHVRRGDYTSPHLAAFHPLLSAEYYQKAFRYIVDTLYLPKVDSDDIPTKFLIFSDDIKFCQDNFKGENIIIVDNFYYKEYAAVVDLCMMSMCKYSIIANSTFSYWGAYLGEEKKIVIYPHVWFGPGYNNFNIVDVEGWIKI